MIDSARLDIDNILFLTTDIVGFFIIFGCIARSGGQIDRYGKKAELLIMIIVPIIFLAIDVLVYFPLKTDSGKASTYVSHFLFLFFQIGFAAMMLATHGNRRDIHTFCQITCRQSKSRSVFFDIAAYHNVVPYLL